MSAGARGLAAQVHFDGWRKPAETIAVTLRVEECRLGEVHFHGDVLHPDGVSWTGKDTNCGGVARKRAVGESVHLVNRDRHHSSYAAPTDTGRREEGRGVMTAGSTFFGPSRNLSLRAPAVSR